jgi:hypothetical protein
VDILPAFVDEANTNWDSQAVIDFLGTKAYLEAKEIVNSLEI